ncbi:hypothetical protein WH47_11554 [Habropoda laboriosa]|uniref:Copia protein n=1 Tax=Habropoda laboriosa TaxID=597456 RepID=A0A0L7QLT8_9HYME|nr:hypothetical protein WH47_11554 [Habropoda laboriosa]
MLLEDLIHHKMAEGEDMRDHVSRFADTVSKFEAMEIVIPQKMLVVILLSSIPPSYESLSTLSTASLLIGFSIANAYRPIAY